MASKGDKKFWVRCTEEEYKEIQTDAEKEGLYMGDVMLAKYFGYEIIKPEKEIEIKECPMVILRGEKKYKYSRKYVVKAKPYLKKLHLNLQHSQNI
jgi:hypothetical protein